MTTKKSDFKTFLNEIRRKAKNEREKGTLFEKAIKDFLKQSPEHSFENVWMWSEWPELSKYNFPKQDLGIDLVAKEEETGDFWAIQCKCYGEEYQVNKPDIDSFFNQLGKKPFKTGLIVTTTDNWGTNAEESLKSRTKKCHIFGLHDLEKVDFEWSLEGLKRKRSKKTIRDHQRRAVNNTIEYFKTKDRGKLIMACGTGKTFTSLRVTERITSEKANILFLAPSISLISQTLREYAYERAEGGRWRYLVVCSDKKVGKDSDGVDINDLQIAPTTEPQKITERLNYKQRGRTVVFSTYQSLKQIKKAQELGAPKFDLVICDEAHRATGVEGSKEGNKKTKGNYFTMINDENYVKARKRLYMTATPKIYSPAIKKKAKEQDVEIHSMDNKSVYGEEIYRLDFSEAVNQKLLTDYKVIILTVNQQYVMENMQGILGETQLRLEDAARLIGCYKALRDQGNKNGDMLSRAVGFLNKVKDSKKVKAGFQIIVKALDAHKNDRFTCETEHIDGNDSSIKRNKKLDWLKRDAGYTNEDEKICRILMNAKCLTEGIDVPNLDAIMFLHPRKSQVDVVQAVGRVMRKQEGKKYGYVILPVVIPDGKSPEQALNDNNTYKVVWQVLSALRSHDSRFDAIINNLELNKNKPEQIQTIGIGFGNGEEEEAKGKNEPEILLNLQYNIKDIESKIYAKIIEKCGNMAYEKRWTKEIEKICKIISKRIESLLNQSPKIQKEFQNYYDGLKSSINEGIKKEEAISMLSEHLITKPIFDKIFEGYKFSESNPVSKTMKKVLNNLDLYGFKNELKDLEEFYKNIVERIDGIDNSKSRQKIIKELYENFIKTAFPKTAEKLGVAYTPIEVVDFILKSVNEILKEEFNRSLTSEGVHVIDPFVGTGTFINRLIQIDSFIETKDLTRKFSKEIHANEILLLPYYVASINIEEAYHSRMSKIKGEATSYKPFQGIALTDTFNINEPSRQEDNVIPLFQENKERIENQKKSPIEVIIGNPPYSAGQKSENDGNKNTEYPLLKEKIQETYAFLSTAKAKNALHDSYVKAIRWATDRIGNNDGIVAFVHNGSLIDERSLDGARKCLETEFSSIYCFNLRGNTRNKGAMEKKEGGKIFGSNSRASIAITLLVKDKASQSKEANIKYYDIGDYLTREQKLEKIKKLDSIKNIDWQNIIPDQYGDWVNQRDDSFDTFYPMKDIFNLYSSGITTSRDLWVYNFNKNQLKKNMKNTIQVYNEESERLKHKILTPRNIDKFINLDKKKISWSSSLKSSFIKSERAHFSEKCIQLSSYRPFMRAYLYFDKMFNHRQGKNPKLFIENKENRVICVSGIGAKTFSVLMTDSISDYNFITPTQCFPLYHFDKTFSRQFDAITDESLTRFKRHYANQSSQKIQKKDIFYYIYGVLHSQDYRERYKSNLRKSLPHIPFAKDFWGFSEAGRKLAKLHLNYESQKSPKGVKILKNGQEIALSKIKDLSTVDLKIVKMKIYKNDTSKIDFNENITIRNIPSEVWDYEINGWPAIKYIVDRYQYTENKDTGIVNDPNAYSDDSAYILKLLLSIMTVSLEINKVVQNLPSIDFDSTKRKIA